MGCKINKFGIISIIIVYLALTVFAAQYIDDTQGEFDLGTYTNTTYNGSAVILSGQNISGEYQSRVFDASSDAAWNNLSWQGNNQETIILYGVDGAGDVYSSTDSITWLQDADNYGRTSDTIEMFSDNYYLYIISNSNREVWRSSDGQTWVVVNNSFADSNLLVAEADYSGNLFVADASGDVYISSNYGASWTKKGDFNGGATNNAKGMGLNRSNAIFIVDGSGAVFASVDSGQTWTEKSSGYGGGSGTDDLEVDSAGNLYILLNKAVYKSANSGVAWSIINDSFTSYSNDGLKMLIDKNDNFYIADGVGRIFKSIDHGISWTEKGDFNAGASNDPKGLTTFTQYTNISFKIRNCSQADCSDTSFINKDLNNINLVSRYFQYQADLLSPSTNVTPSLLNVTVRYTLINQKPVVSSLSLTPPSPKTINDLTCSFIITDTDAGDSLTANITWYRNNAAYSSIIQAVTNGSQASSILDSSNTAKNEVWNCTVIPYDETEYGIQDSNKITIQNSPPTAPNISITPGSPITTNDLNVIFNSLSQDNDSDPITYSYSWYKNNVLQPAITGSTVSSGVTSKNEIWLVNVTPNDGETSGNKATDSITIQNSIPSITSASITPTSVYETTTLTSTAEGWSDLDQEPENYIYQWFNQNGKIAGATSQTLTGVNFNKNDQVYCNITPYDSDGYGASKLTNIVAIQNSLPVITTNIISELGFNGTDEDLIGSFTASDSDLDTITDNQTKWYKDGIEQTNLAGLAKISHTNTSADEVWTFSARAYDREAWGNWHNTSLTIMDISQTYPTLLSPSNGAYFNVSNVVLTYTTPNYANMNCTIYADTNANPIAQIKNNTALQGKTTIIYNWISLADAQYYWKAGCTNDSIMLNSTIKTFIIDTIYPITSPTLTQSGVADSDNDGNIELSWAADPDAAAYNIYRSPVKITDAANLTKIGSSSSTSWEDNTTLHNNVYWYALTTVDAAGNENKSIVSDSFNATPNDTIMPKLPINVNASSVNGITTIYWTKVTQDTSQNSDILNLQYKIWYRQNSTINLSKLLVNETADYIKTLTQDSCSEASCSTTHALSGSTQYYYFITTMDDANNENLTLDENYANVTATAAPPTSGGSSGGGGGGGGTTPAKKECKEDWSCSEWYSCINDVQARTCIDVNSCGTPINKPEETRQCGSCIEKWQCGDWTPCVNNIQTRVCIDKNDCETEKDMPEKERECAIEICSDGIKNYGEVGIDCGGPCRPCKASDFITGGAIALSSSKGPNTFLLIPTVILLLIFIAIKTIRKSDQLDKVVSLLHIPMVVLITALFIFSFFGPQITGFFTAEKENLEEPMDYTQDKIEPAVVPLTSSPQFSQTKAKIASIASLLIISIALLSLIIKKKLLLKLKQRVKPPKTERLSFQRKTNGKIVNFPLFEWDSNNLEKKRGESELFDRIKEKIEAKLPIKEIKDIEIEIQSKNNVEEQPFNKETKIRNQSTKQEILNQIKEIYYQEKIEK